MNKTFETVLNNDMNFFTKKERKREFMRGLSLDAPKNQEDFDYMLVYYNLSASDFTPEERRNIEELVNE